MQHFHVRVSHHVLETALVVVRAVSASHVRAMHASIYTAVAEKYEGWEVSGDMVPQDIDVEILNDGEADLNITPGQLRLLPVFEIDPGTSEVRKVVVDQKAALRMAIQEVIEKNLGRSLDDEADRVAVMNDLMAALG